MSIERHRGIETDYLVIGAGATGLAFTDALIEEADVTVTVVDRRPGPGGHWRDVYPFVRLHTPSAFYGVNSVPLGEDRVDATGENAGFYERATGAEVCEYLESVARKLEASGRVRFLYSEDRRAVEADVRVRRRVVDARYLESSIPATHAPSFEIADDVRFIPVNGLPDAIDDGEVPFAILGAGKTAVDACAWLIEQGVDPDRITWIRPREAWFYDRRHFQPREQVAGIMDGLALDAEAAAGETSLTAVMERLESAGRLVRVDPTVEPTMFRGTMLSRGELDAVRRIRNVVRLGKVRRVERGRLVLERGEVSTDPGTIHVDCTAAGLSGAPAAPVFQDRRMVLQQVRHLSPCFNAALTAVVETRFDGDAEKNRLCPPNPYPSAVEDWPAMMATTWRAEARWLRGGLSDWVGTSRLNLLRDLPDHLSEPAPRQATDRFLAHVEPAIANLVLLAPHR